MNMPQHKPPLSKTLQDHLDVGGTPPNRLAENPGKSLGELMSEEEIIAHLKESKKAIKELEEMGLGEHRVYCQQVVNYLKDIEYLASLGKLPKGFEKI